MKEKYRVVLAGNPNCGKTSVFNQLTGTRQHVGNYPGVTVESKSGTFDLPGMQIELIDLPGIYSLSSSSPEEKVAFQELITPGIDLIINVVDSSIPQRSLYLTTQLAELNIPMLIAFNMSDEAEKKGLSFKFGELEKYFHAKIVRTIGTKRSGVQDLKDAIPEILKQNGKKKPHFCFNKHIDAAIKAITDQMEAKPLKDYSHIPARFFVIKLLEKDLSAWSMPELQEFLPEVEKQLQVLQNKHSLTSETFMADCRYALISGACRHCITASRERRWEISDKIDTVLTNKIVGLPIFLLIMYLTFWLTFRCAEPLMGAVEFAIERFAALLANAWPAGKMLFLKSMLIDGIISGVGAVIEFLPNILLLFLAISFLEDSGYMARAAFVTDGIMRRFGLHGKSFVPLVLGFGCTVPAIMATRSIESEKDRITTILVLPLMSCSARLPIYALIIPAFFTQKHQASVMLLMYVIGIVFGLAGALLMKKTLFRGESEVYLMELPPYRMPTFKSILLHMWDRCLLYLEKAGTIILAASIVLFIFNTFPQKKVYDQDYKQMEEIAKAQNGLTDHQIKLLTSSGLLEEEAAKFLQKERYLPLECSAKLEEIPFNPETRAALKKSEQLAEELQEISFTKQAEGMEYTISGRIGKFCEPFFKPLGFDWRICTAVVGSLTAREVFVSQLGILFSVGADEDAAVIPLRQHLVRNYTPLQGFSIILFCLLSLPCIATLVIIRKELNSWKYAIADGLGLFTLAYVTTFIVYQIGLLLQIGI